MREKLQVFTRRKFVIQWNQNATALQNRVGADQPLRLVGHDDGGVIAWEQLCILQSTGEWRSHLLEVGVCEARALAISVGFDQTGLIRPAV
jgi:surfactin synthase thioesterase subunit